MQKFGLQKNSSYRHTAIELEIVREQASALGRVGRKLRLSLEHYEAILSQAKAVTRASTNLNQEHDSILEISNNVWELILQRELLGFTEGNLQWILANYVIPDAAINRLGLNAQ